MEPKLSKNYYYKKESDSAFERGWVIDDRFNFLLNYPFNGLNISYAHLNKQIYSFELI